MNGIRTVKAAAGGAQAASLARAPFHFQSKS
jgi:hypothetical protein